MYRKCMFCGKYFEPNVHNQKYCSRYCKDKAANWKRELRGVRSGIRERGLTARLIRD